MKIGPRYALVYSKVQPTEEANLGSEHETKKRACTQVHYVRKVLYVTQKNTAEPGKCWYNTACCPGVHPYPHPQKLLKMEPRLKCELVWRLQLVMAPSDMQAPVLEDSHDFTCSSGLEGLPTSPYTCVLFGCFFPRLQH